MAIEEYAFISSSEGSGWGGASGALSKLLGRVDGENAGYEAKFVGANVVVDATYGLRFNTQTSGAATWLGRADYDFAQSPRFGNNLVFVFSFSLLASQCAGLSAPFKILSRGTGKDKAILTISSDRKLHLYDGATTPVEILTASTAMHSSGMVRGALVIETWTGSHGGNYLIWLLAETAAGTYTEVGAYATLTLPWAVSSGDWWWGEQLAGGVNLAVSMFMTDLCQMRYGTNYALASPTHANSSPHLVAAPIPKMFPGIADANGAVQQFNHTTTPYYTNVNDGDDANTSNTASASKIEANGAATVAGLDAILPLFGVDNPQFRFRSQASAGKLVYGGQMYLQINGNVAQGGTEPVPATSYAYQAAGVVRKPTAAPPPYDQWVPADAANVEFGASTLSNHGSQWDIEAVGLYWYQKLVAWPLLSDPTPVGDRRRMLAQVI